MINSSINYKYWNPNKSLLQPNSYAIFWNEFKGFSRIWTINPLSTTSFCENYYTGITIPTSVPHPCLGVHLMSIGFQFVVSVNPTCFPGEVWDRSDFWLHNQAHVLAISQKYGPSMSICFISENQIRFPLCHFF